MRRAGNEDRKMVYVSRRRTDIERIVFLRRFWYKRLGGGVAASIFTGL